MSIRRTLPYTFGGGSGPDPDAELYITNAQIVTPSLQTAVRTLVSYLKTNGLWTRAKILYPMLTDYKNPLIYTEDFSNAIWVKTGLTVSSYSTSLPAGITSASLLVPTAVSSTHQAVQGTAFYTQQNNVFSVYAKAAGYNWLRLNILCSGNSFYQKSIWFDLQNGVFGSSLGGATLVANSSTSLGNGWYRIQLTVTNLADTGRNGVNVTVAPADADLSTTFTGNGTDGIYATGAQLDFVSSTATSYEACLAASPMPDQMKYNLRDARDMDAAYRITWTAWGTLGFYPMWGVNSNTTSGQGNTHLVANAALTQDDTSLHFYSIANNRSGAFRFEFGNFDGAGSLSIGVGNTTNTLRSRINTTTPTDQAQPSNTTVGLSSVSRQNATQQKIYKDGTLLSTQAANSDGLAAVEMPILALREFGTVNSWSQQNCGFFECGGGYSEAEMALLYTGLYNFQVAVGRQV